MTISLHKHTSTTERNTTKHRCCITDNQTHKVHISLQRAAGKHNLLLYKILHSQFLKRNCGGTREEWLNVFSFFALTRKSFFTCSIQPVLNGLKCPGNCTNSCISSIYLYSEFKKTKRILAGMRSFSIKKILVPFVFRVSKD